MNDQELATYRVAGSKGIGYRSLAMNSDQILARRSYIRNVLRMYPAYCNNMANAKLDSIRLMKISGGRYILEDEEGREYLLPATTIQSDETEFRKVRAMMPFEFTNLTGKDFNWSSYKADTSEAVSVVNKYILHFEEFREKGLGLYIYSKTKGSGKTMLACCILNELAKRYHGSIKFINALDFVEITKKSFKGDQQEVDALYQAAVLVIDDIGVQLTKEWTDTVFYRLINDRYVNRRPTIYTSNVPSDKLKMDDRVVDRIESTTYLVGLPDESVRRAIRQQEKERLMQEIKENAP